MPEKRFKNKNYNKLLRKKKMKKEKRSGKIIKGLLTGSLIFFSCSNVNFKFEK